MTGAGPRALLELAGSSLESLRKKAPGVAVELYLERGEERGVTLRHGEPESLKSVREEGAGLRLLRDGRCGFASAGGLAPETIERLFRTVMEQLPHLEPDAMTRFGAPRPEASAPDGLEASLWDDSICSEPPERWQERLAEAHAVALGQDRRVRSVPVAACDETRGEVAVVNSFGVAASEKSSSATMDLSVLAEGKDGEVQHGDGFACARRRAGLDPLRAAREAAWRATSLLDARKLRGGRRAMLFDPWVATELLELLGEFMCADAVQRGKSLLAGKLGERIGSKSVTIVDDPWLKGGAASRLWDDEGRPTRRKTLVGGGVLADLFYDTASAARDGRRSNASAERGSYRGLPVPGPTNLFMAPGTVSRDRLISDTAKGLLVLEAIGMQLTDPVSGEVSVGVSGVAVEMGRLTHAVKGCMISGNVLELFSRIDLVADDLTFHGSLGSPTFRIADVTVA